MLFYMWVTLICVTKYLNNKNIYTPRRLRAQRFMLIAMCWPVFLLIWWNFSVPNRWVPLSWLSCVETVKNDLSPLLEHMQWWKHSKLSTERLHHEGRSQYSGRLCLHRKIGSPGWYGEYWKLSLIDTPDMRVSYFRLNTCTSPPGNFAWSALSMNAQLISSTTCRMIHALRLVHFPVSIATRTSYWRSISSSPIM